MDGFAKMKLPTQTMRRLNYCRMYLRVERLSDIATNDGKKIQGRYMSGVMRNPYTNKTWPHQIKPDKNTWKLWRLIVHNTFLHGLMLKKPLLRWIQEDRSYNKWCDGDHKIIMKLNGRLVQSITTMTRTTMQNHNDSEETQSPKTLCPIIEGGQEKHDPR